MPLAKNLEELLKHMEPAVAKAQREFWEANPAIAEAMDKGTVPQAEFNRQLNAKDTEVKAAREKAEEWKSWADKNKPKHEKLVDDFEKLAQENAALKALREKVAEGTEGTTLNATELAERVLEQVKGKTVTTEQLTQLIAAEKTTMMAETGKLIDGARKEFLEKTFPQTVNFNAELTEVMLLHRDEAGKMLDRDALAKYMQENAIVSPRAAYDKMMEPVRMEKKIDAEVDKRLGEKLAKANVPGVSSGQSELGPLQLKIAGETPTFKEGTELGDLSASAMAAAEIRKEGRV